MPEKIYRVVEDDEDRRTRVIAKCPICMTQKDGRNLCDCWHMEGGEIKKNE